MFETLLNTFQNSPLSLWGPFLVLLLCGLGLPIPEDIVLIASGVLGESLGRNWIEVSAIMYVGVIGGDCITFFAGRHVGGWMLTSRWFQRIVSTQKQAKVVAFFENYGPMGLFIARFLPGLRAPIFFSAGSMKVPFWKMLFFDGLAALISVPAFVWLGHWLWAKFQDDLEQFNRTLLQSQGYAIWAAAAIVVISTALFWVWISRRKVAKHD